jgi:hypothetical protein
MESEEQKVALYDFLYRDSSRITSLYSQIFGGHLTSLEETDSIRDSKDRGARLNMAVASGDIKSSEENLTSHKRVTVPHDILATDVLSFFQEKGRIHEDVEAAPHGSIIKASGTLVFIDRIMLGFATIVLQADVEAKRKVAKTPQQREEVQELKRIIPFLASIDLPSGFVLHVENGLDVSGTLKESGMEEPIPTYYFKHGTAGLSSVYVIGIKETPAHSFTLPNSQLIGAGQVAAQALRNMTFPPDSIMVTPIALFREL